MVTATPGLDAIAAEAATVTDAFRAEGHRLYLVGGIVRDLLLERPVSDGIDLDLTTDARPSEIKAIVGPLADAVWLQGERYGTIGARVDGRAYEITTHRSEVYDPDSRKPDVAFSTAIAEDLSRRDFTVNAMAVELPDLHLIDPFGGHRDLQGRRLRTPLDPDISFTDDPLRMLRAARFVAGYGLDPAPEVVEAMHRLRTRLDIVSVERVRDELDKLLALESPVAGLGLLERTGLLERFLPEVGSSTLESLADALTQLPPTGHLRLAALLWPAERDAVARRLRRLRYSNHVRSDVSSTLAAADALVRGAVVDPPSLRRWVAACADLRDGARMLAAAMVPASGPVVDRSVALERELDPELDDLGPALTGDEVMAELGMHEGPEVGVAMDFLQELRFTRGPLSPAAALVELRRWMESRERE